MTPLARLVRERRRALGLTTEELADKIGCKRSMVEQVERCWCMFRVDDAMRWCRALDVAPARLLEAAESSVRVRPSRQTNHVPRGARAAAGAPPGDLAAKRRQGRS